MKRIMIVEDEQLVAADLELKLQRLGFKVVGIAASGPEAIRLGVHYKPDLILMDIRLQGAMDGMETARLLQAQITVKIIFLSAYAQLQTRADVSPAEFLSKPYSIAQLSTALQNALI